MTEFHVHLVSDSTGETLISMAKAALAQFEDSDPKEHVWALVRSERQLDNVLEGIERNPGVVFFTLMDKSLRKRFEKACRKLDVPHVSVLDQVMKTVGDFLGAKARGLPGRQHVMDQEYFDRIDAMHYTMAHDDGQMPQDLYKADIVLVGVSRTSKTPTAIYLANRGINAANVPLVPGCPLPQELLQLKDCLIVGLTTSPERLVQVRRNRLLSLHETSETEYVNFDVVKEEVANARKLCMKNGWPVIDVARRSIEETAAAVLNLYYRRMEEQEKGEGSA